MMRSRIAVLPSTLSAVLLCPLATDDTPFRTGETTIEEIRDEIARWAATIGLAAQAAAVVGVGPGAFGHVTAEADDQDDLAKKIDRERPARLAQQRDAEAVGDPGQQGQTGRQGCE